MIRATQASRQTLARWPLQATAIAILLVPALGAAQAWLPTEGSLTAAFSYNDILNKKHYLPDGEEADAGHTRSHVYGATVAYSPTRRFMVTAGLPYVVTKYWGDRPHPTEVDDGDSHATFTDLRISAHFQALLEPFAFAPYLAVVIPTHDYETLGHAAPGRGLNETWLGFGIGKNLAAWVPRSYVQARANYAFVEKVAGVSHDRTNLDLELGHFLTPQWSVRALGLWQFAHGGVEVPMPRSNPLFPYHDQLAADSFTNLGVGAAFSATQKVSIYAVYLTSIRGENAHKVDHGVTLGMSIGLAPLRQRIEKQAATD